MNPSESFSDQPETGGLTSRNINNQTSYKCFDEPEFEQNSLTENALDRIGVSSEPELSWIEPQNQTDVEVLQQQLASAHQLLVYQKKLIYSLTEKVTNREASLAKSEQIAFELRKKYEAQTVELNAVQSVCCDLRSLLQRQQHRLVPSTPPPMTHTYTVNRSVKSAEKDLISFGYESASEPSELMPSTKSPPVEVWSRGESENPWNSPLPFYRKLATMIVAASDSSFESPHAVKPSYPLHSPTAAGQVELPHFASVSRSAT